MQKLPHWILPEKFPALYDSESATTIEMTAKVYGAMQALIDDYNRMVTDINAEIVKFESDVNANVDDFKKCIVEMMENFTQSMQCKIDDAYYYMKNNIELTATNVINEALENGTITVVENYDPNSEALEIIAKGVV